MDPNTSRTDDRFDRFDIPMVSSDGEPHAVLTMVAMASGFIVAVAVLLVLISLIDFSRNQSPSSRSILMKKQRTMSMFSVFSKRQSIDITVDPAHLEKGIGAYRSTEEKRISSTAKTTGNQLMHTNERLRIDETMFTTDGKLLGISTVSC